jgi:hypothetical protein
MEDKPVSVPVSHRWEKRSPRANRDGYDGSDDTWVREWKRTSKRMSNSFARKVGPGTMRTTRAVQSARPRHCITRTGWICFTKNTSKCEV